jgi:WASH complex subunit strumpellin
MQDMVRIIGINENTLATLAVIGDSSYAWGLIQEYTPLLHAQIREEPQTVSRLRCWFLKLKSVLELPLLRLSQVGSKDLYPVSQFYSSQLVDYIRSVLEVIPGNMVGILVDTVAKQAQRIGEVPTRLERAAVRGQVQGEERLQLARAARLLAVLSSGVLKMDKVLIGVVEMQAGSLLEDGLREQLRACIEGSCNGFRIENGREGLEVQLGELQARLGALRRALEMCQDYLHVQAVRAWDEEWGAYLQDCAQREEQRLKGAKKLAKNKSFLGIGKQAVRAPRASFWGQVLDAVLALSDPATSMFLRPVSGWFDANGEKRVGLQLWATIRRTVGVEGLVSLSHLLGIRARTSLQQAADVATELVGGDGSSALESLYRALLPLSGLPAEGARRYAERGTWNFGELACALAAVGQAVLLRGQLAAELAGAVRLEGAGLVGAVQGLDEAARNALLTSTESR